jgi:NadR type nicotinamide-nucleotide adenylyltransferase
MYKIAVLGPESTGKTDLTKALAEHFASLWVPEYAREYVEKLTVPYTYNDVCNIAQKQIEQEKQYEETQNTQIQYVFFDTDLIITKVWFEYKYGNIPAFLTERLKTGFFDFYLLCAPDLPWEPDPVREHGDDRDFFFNWYKSEIEKMQKPYAIITGKDNQRIENAIVALHKLQKENNTEI